MSAGFIKRISQILENQEPRQNEHGNTRYYFFHPSERYGVDFDSDFTADGWLQFDTDQDAHYFGVWLNPKLLQVLSYAEGDWYLIQCVDAVRYNAQVRSMIGFYGEGFICKTLDDQGRWTTYVQDRATFLLPEPEIVL